MRIAVDVMGGDKAPHQIVLGCLEAVRRIDELPGVDQIVMVGKEDAVKAELAKCRASLGEHLAFVQASESIDMDEAPAAAVRKKKDNSLTRCMELVKSGEAQAMVSAGNSGAFAAAALFTLGRIKGVTRPIIATVLPTRGEKPIIVADAGANMDCAPEWMAQFAIMGGVYAEKVIGSGDRPKIGLVNIGTEECKGNEFTHEAFKHLREAGVNFVGNVQGHDLFKGELDVAVCDGFVGNIILKTTESVAKAIAYWIKAAVKSSVLSMLGALLMKGSFAKLKKRMDPERYGGAILLGVDGNCIVTHGAATHKAIFYAIQVAANATKNELGPTIASRIRAYNEKVAERKAAEEEAKAAEALAKI